MKRPILFLVIFAALGVLMLVLAVFAVVTYVSRSQLSGVGSVGQILNSDEYRSWLAKAEQGLADSGSQVRIEPDLTVVCVLNGSQVIRAFGVLLEPGETEPTGGARVIEAAWFSLDGSTKAVTKYDKNPCP